MSHPIDVFPHITALEPSMPVEYPEKVEGVATVGAVPDWVNGSWYRNGPGIIHFKKQSVNHWFDGMALARKFTIKDGQVSYMSRLIDGESKKRNLKAGKLIISEFGTAASHEGLDKIIKMVKMPDLTDNCLVNFMMVDRHLLAITESNVATLIDPATLETIKTIDLSKSFPMHVMGSHPLHEIDGKNQFLFSTCIFDHGHTKYHLLRLPGEKAGLPEELTVKEVMAKGGVVNSIHAGSRLNPSYHHSFSMTQNFAVFIEMPLRLEITSLATAHLVGKTCIDCMQDQPGLESSIFLLPKTKDIKHPLKYTCREPVYVWHHVNCYEEQDHLILDVCVYQKPIFHKKFYVADLKLPPVEYAKKFEEKSSRIVRLVLPLTIKEDSKVGDNVLTLPGATGSAILRKNKVIEVSMETIVEGVDFPVINEKFRGVSYNYFYSPGGQYLPPGDKLSKISIEDKKIVASWQEKGCWCSQPVFVPHPDSKAEDQGVLLSNVSDANGKPFLLILDGQNFSEVSRVHFDANIPPDIHGIFVSE